MTWPPQAGIKPYYWDEATCIFHGDCRDIFPAIYGTTLITDPPFGISWSRATWDDNFLLYPDLINWLVTIASANISGWCFIFQAMLNVHRFHEWFPQGWRIFAACKNFVQANQSRILYSWDPVVFWDNGDKYISKDKQYINRDFHVGNVSGNLRFPVKHPCPRPLDTMKHLVMLACPVDGILVDPYMGSGTTVVAGKELGRKSIGIEIEERNCEIAVNRLRQEVMHLPYAQPTPCPALVQEALF